MKERPILFSGPMVRAILEDRKTQTRRVMKPQPDAKYDDAVDLGEVFPEKLWCMIGPQRDAQGVELPVERWVGGWPDCSPQFRCPHGVPGDRLWVRETWYDNMCPRQDGDHDLFNTGPTDPWVFYRADGLPNFEGEESEIRWRPAIHMFRWACRITLEITEVRVQRLQKIDEADAEAEGLTWPADLAFPQLWDSINAKRGFAWDTNPWVWALTFRRLA